MTEYNSGIPLFINVSNKPLIIQVFYFRLSLKCLQNTYRIIILVFFMAIFIFIYVHNAGYLGPIMFIGVIVMMAGVTLTTAVPNKK